MLKITIQVVENKDGESSKVTIQNPKDLSKGTENEKTVTAIVIDKIQKALQELQS